MVFHLNLLYFSKRGKHYTETVHWTINIVFVCFVLFEVLHLSQQLCMLSNLSLCMFGNFSCFFLLSDDFFPQKNSGTHIKVSKGLDPKVCDLWKITRSAIILMWKRELVALLNLSSRCLVMVERLFLAVPRGCLQFVIVVFPDHTHYFWSHFFPRQACLSGKPVLHAHT